MALITNALKKQEMTQHQPHQLSTSSNQSEDEEDRLPTPPPLPDVSRHRYSVLDSISINRLRFLLGRVC